MLSSNKVSEFWPIYFRVNVIRLSTAVIYKCLPIAGISVLDFCLGGKARSLPKERTFEVMRLERPIGEQ
jgi:hypothetical protein